GRGWGGRRARGGGRCEGRPRPGRDEGEGAMGIVFFCQSCGARFEVDPRMAGKSGHCKKCGQLMTIPRPDEIASMVAMPALAGAGVGGTYRAAAAGSPIGALLQAGISKVGPAPSTV